MRRPSDDELEVMFYTLLVAAMLTMWLLLGTCMTGCCQEPAQPIALGKTEIVKLEDGSWKVSPGWMARRMNYERALLHQRNEARRQRCLDR